MTPALERGLPRAVYHYLRFQRECGRSGIFSEGYLAQPVLEYLASQISGKVVTEYPHPIFRTLRGSGRPKQVDFAVLTRDTRDVESVVEVKWIRERAYGKQAIVNDLMRLECFRGSRQVKRYFLVAGEASHVAEYFEDLVCNHQGRRQPFTTTLLSFDKSNADRHVRVEDGRLFLRSYFLRFAKDYDCEIPLGFQTQLVGGVPANTGVSTYLWRVKSNRNRAGFRPTRHWAEPH